MILWDQIVSLFKNDSHSQSLETETAKANPASVEDHKLELFDFLSQKNGADFNIIDSNGWSPILRCIKIDNVEIMKLLISKSNSANFNISSCVKHTPLTYAIFREAFEIIGELIKSGADVDKEDYYGWTPP